MVRWAGWLRPSGATRWHHYDWRDRSTCGLWTRPDGDPHLLHPRMKLCPYCLLNLDEREYWEKWATVFPPVEGV